MQKTIIYLSALWIVGILVMGLDLAWATETSIQFIRASDGLPLAHVSATVSGILAETCTYEVRDGNYNTNTRSVTVDIFLQTDSEGRVVVDSFFALRNDIEVPVEIRVQYAIYASSDIRDTEPLFAGETTIRQFETKVVRARPFVRPEEGPEFIRGDANADGIVNISDAIATFYYLYLGSQQLTCLDAADSNDDGRLDISDGINTLNVLFYTHDCRGPILDHRQDPTPDALNCQTYAPERFDRGEVFKVIEEVR